MAPVLDADATAAVVAASAGSVSKGGPLAAPPPAPEFSSEPASLSELDVDVIKLTAQFVALNGSGFLTQVHANEGRTALFDFLRPQHGMFEYFTALVEQYSKVRRTRVRAVLVSWRGGSSGSFRYISLARSSWHMSTSMPRTSRRCAPVPTAIVASGAHRAWQILDDVKYGVRWRKHQAKLRKQEQEARDAEQS